ncbi:hypothetical protein [Streptomyces iconiensis]|uniref:Uncharacterized protein n=1 Tax=Streptomyces iconiensis TaxID=1384038 RepID=A0ABT7A9C3_9ACTN|nr:hypothetical protein [Streptomyces iconiensis]MDJ1137933.1 hypothetical protein [Streptomyces iconiensis]
MPVHVCSLINNEPQTVPGGGAYYPLHFPFGTGESADEHVMHQMAQPDGHQIDNWRTDDRAGLIWPTVDGWGSLTANIHWEAGDYSELRDRFVRDPLGLSTGADTTATDHRAPSYGMQCFTKHHAIFVHPGTPIALYVAHTDHVPRRVMHAQFKLAIHT